MTESNSNGVYDRMKIARELGYSEEVISKLKRARTEAEQIRIMITARKEQDKKC